MAIQDVVLRYKAKKDEEFGDPIPRRLRCIEEAEKPYERVTSWFGDPESEDNPVRFHEETVMLEDGWLGDYEMKCLDIEVTVYRDNDKPLISRWGRLGGENESPSPSSPGAEPRQAR